MKKIKARFYVANSGRRPVRDWILGLNAEDRLVVGRDIQKIEFGWPIGMPYCRSLGNGLWEVRIDFSGGRIGRVIFCIVDDEMILLNGFIKKTQNAPAAELDLAKRRKRDVE